VLTEEKLDGIGAKLDHTPRKSMKRLVQETGVSKSSARRVTQLLNLRPYKTTVIHAFQPCDPASRVHFCSWFLQSVIKGEINKQLTFFTDEVRFHFEGYINIKNNRCCSSRTSHLGKVGGWCAVSARRIVGPVFLMKKLIAKDMYRLLLGNSFQS
jgi:hypothetical protein